MPGIGSLTLYFLLGTAFLAGAYVCLLNFYLSFLRYPLHIRNGGSREEYKFVSGIPVFGSLFIFILLRNLELHPVIFYPGVVLMLMDTGGLHWFAGMILYQAFLSLKSKLTS